MYPTSEMLKCGGKLSSLESVGYIYLKEAIVLSKKFVGIFCNILWKNPMNFLANPIHFSSIKTALQNIALQFRPPSVHTSHFPQLHSTSYRSNFFFLFPSFMISFGCDSWVHSVHGSV